jgi:hypothetical protein
MKSWAVFFFAVCVLSSCATVGQVDQNITLKSNEESIFVMGVSPANAKILMFPGEIKNGEFAQDKWRNASFWGAPVDGYIVGRATSKELLAITGVTLLKENTAFYGQQFRPCNGVKTMAFNVPGGKVAYLGHVDYEVEGNTLKVHYSKDLAVAKKHIEAKYPELRGKLEQAEYELRPASISCIDKTVIPIYIPSRK